MESQLKTGARFVMPNGQECIVVSGGDDSVLVRPSGKGNDCAFTTDFTISPNAEVKILSCPSQTVALS